MLSSAVWVRRIQLAIDTHNVFFHCQPILKPVTREIVIYEVLARLKDPEGCFIPAIAFIDYATLEQLVSIDCLAIEFTLRHLLHESSLPHAINLAPTTLDTLDFQIFLIEQLAKYELKPGFFLIEVTEQAALTVTSEHFITSLRSLQLLVGVDDFGKGAATVPAFRSLKPDFLKVDGEIVRSIVFDYWAECVVFGAMAMAYRRDIPIILEHIETGLLETKALTLARHFPGLQLLTQGYLYQAPKPC